MNIQQFWSDVLAQRADEIREYFHADAYVNWHCSNEHFTVEEFIRANCEYPGDWDGEVGKIITTDDMIITATRVYPKDRSASYHVTSFIKLKGDIYMQCGPIRYRVDAREQAEKRSFDHYLIPRFTNYHSSDSEKTITDYYRDLVNDEARNELIIQDIRQLLEQGRCPLVLTERREHVQLLAQRLTPFCKNIILLFGTPSQKERRETLERLRAMPDTEPLLLIATGKYVGEGFDYPRLDTLFLTLPISWKGKVAQYAGRLHRNYPEKKEVQIYDYVDLHVPMLETMYQRRLKGYAAIGYKLKTDSAKDATPDLIYDGKSFFPVYCQDLRNAMQSIQILSPFLKKTRVREIAKYLADPLSKGATVTVLTRPPEDFPEKSRTAITESTELLRKIGIHVHYRSAFHQKFTIIDNRTVWYGSINFLSFGASEESIMRFTNRDIALQLAESISPTPKSR